MASANLVFGGHKNERNNFYLYDAQSLTEETPNKISECSVCL